MQGGIDVVLKRGTYKENNQLVLIISHALEE